MALKQMNDDWLKLIDDNKIVGAVLVDQCSLLHYQLVWCYKKHMCYVFTLSAISWIES
jgi:hypothetical protein